MKKYTWDPVKIELIANSWGHKKSLNYFIHVPCVSPEDGLAFRILNDMFGYHSAIKLYSEKPAETIWGIDFGFKNMVKPINGA